MYAYVHNMYICIYIYIHIFLRFCTVIDHLLPLNTFLGSPLGKVEAFLEGFDACVWLVAWLVVLH